MDRWLDDFARAMAAGLSRRAALQRVGSGLLTVLLASADVGETEAKGKKSRCGTGQTQCGSGKKAPCVDLQTDGSNCGGCGVVCPSGQSCQAGHCTAPCPTGQTSCSGACVSLLTDSGNCGGCGAACTGGKTCQNGSCASGPGAVTRCASRRDGTKLIVEVSTQSTFDGKPLTFDQSSTSSPGTAPSSSHVVRLGGALVLEIDTGVPSPGTTQVKVVYGGGFQGIHESTFTNDGQMLRGVIDGRSIVPIAVGADLSSMKLADGGPMPVVIGDPGLLQAVQNLVKQAQQGASSCSPSLSKPAAAQPVAGPGSPRPSGPADSSACTGCLTACEIVAAGCLAGVAGGCVFTFFGYAACVAVGAALCISASVACGLACQNGSSCCPVHCGPVVPFGCCFEGETCLNPSTGEGGCCPKSQDTCLGICCPPGQKCTSAGICCEPDHVVCGGVCCKLPKDQETCQQEICCAVGHAVCSGVCCKQPIDKEVCQQGICCPIGQVVCAGLCCGPKQSCVGRTCCPNEQVCGPVCCGELLTCADKSRGTCCTFAAPVCGGKCCNTGDVCVGEACCPKGQVCGKICCPTNQSCKDPSTGGCLACPEGQHPCSGDSGPGEPRCCPLGSSCCTNNTCCSGKNICCGTPPRCQDSQLCLT